MTPSSSTELPSRFGLTETLIKAADDLEATVLLRNAPPSRLSGWAAHPAETMINDQPTASSGNEVRATW
ncbi:MAG TPA: hypothetical protein VK499_00775 [Propionibacteriaceae bacterium]|nr:hypothetical protein [Propionibacteriaceae bacterium]